MGWGGVEWDGAQSGSGIAIRGSVDILIIDPVCVNLGLNEPFWKLGSKVLTRYAKVETHEILISLTLCRL